MLKLALLHGIAPRARSLWALDHQRIAATHSYRWVPFVEGGRRGGGQHEQLKDFAVGFVSIEGIFFGGDFLKLSPPGAPGHAIAHSARLETLPAARFTGDA